MLKRISYIIIICCLYTVQIEAQSQVQHSNKIPNKKKSTDSTKKNTNQTKTKNNASSKNKSVRLSLRIVDDSTKKRLDAAVTIVPVDSVNTLKILIGKSKDSTGFFYASLLPNKNYLITVKDSFYSQYSHELNIRNDLDTIISLKRITYITQDNHKAVPHAEARNTHEAYTFQMFVKYHTPLFISMCVLFFLASAGAVLYIIKLKGDMQSKKEHRSSLDTISELKEDIKTKDAMIDRLNNNQLVAESFPEQIKEEQPEALAAEQSKVPGTTETKRNFICEIMMTAGPRKKFMSEPDADKDLGEDVCGFVSDTKDVLLWVLDGTSDLHCLKNPADKREYFSSRLLAQFLAEKLRQSFTEKQENGFDEIVLKAIQEVKEDFLEQIAQLPDDEKSLLKKNIENKNFPECATTILIARLSLNGDFIAYRSGDSKMILFSASPENKIDLVETSLSIKNDQSNDRLFFRLMLDGNEEFDIFFNHPNHEIINEKNINTTISFSDGIGMDTELLLGEEYKKSPQQVRKEIMYQLQGTGDDKSICFIEIKETK